MTPDTPVRVCGWGNTLSIGTNMPDELHCVNTKRGILTKRKKTLKPLRKVYLCIHLKFRTRLLATLFATRVTLITVLSSTECSAQENMEWEERMLAKVKDLTYGLKIFSL